MAQRKRGDMEPYDKRALIWMTVMRSIKSFDAVLILANAGHGEQAGCFAAHSSRIWLWPTGSRSRPTRR
jgi:hypothetical protein